jgi:hypothetical protein
MLCQDDAAIVLSSSKNSSCEVMAKGDIPVRVQDDAARSGGESNEVDPVDLATRSVSTKTFLSALAFCLETTNSSMLHDKTNLLMVSEDADEDSPHVRGQEREVQHGRAA